MNSDFELLDKILLMLNNIDKKSLNIETAIKWLENIVELVSDEFSSDVENNKYRLTEDDLVYNIDTLLQDTKTLLDRFDVRNAIVYNLKIQSIINAYSYLKEESWNAKKENWILKGLKVETVVEPMRKETVKEVVSAKVEEVKFEGPKVEEVEHKETVEEVVSAKVEELEGAKEEETIITSKPVAKKPTKAKK